jgi:hypothetical protein
LIIGNEKYEICSEGFQGKALYMASKASALWVGWAKHYLAHQNIEIFKEICIVEWWARKPFAHPTRLSKLKHSWIPTYINMN